MKRGMLKTATSDADVVDLIISGAGGHRSRRFNEIHRRATC